MSDQSLLFLSHHTSLIILEWRMILHPKRQEKRKRVIITTTEEAKASQVTKATCPSEKIVIIRTEKMIKIHLMLVTLIVLSTLTKLTECLIEIRALNMPERIENGTHESIVLDCIYSLDESRDNLKLVVKWFFKDDPVPIYQWIPELNKRTYSPRFANKINTNFSIPHGTQFTKFRALNLVNITTDLSGTYSCYVSSLTSQDSKTKDLIVYGKCFYIRITSDYIFYSLFFFFFFYLNTGHFNLSCHCLFSCVISSHTHCQVARRPFPAFAFASAAAAVVLCLPCLSTSKQCIRTFYSRTVKTEYTHTLTHRGQYIVSLCVLCWRNIYTHIERDRESEVIHLTRSVAWGKKGRRKDQ